MKKNKGFTLIELLVVIAIIGILSSVVMVGLNDSRAKSRDAVRAGDLKSLGQASELFQQNINGEGNQFRFPLRISDLGQYFSDNEVPRDPKTGNDYLYGYATSGPKEYCFGAVMETESMQNEEECNLQGNEDYPNRTHPDFDDINYVIKGP